MPATLTPQQFVAKWRNVSANERKIAQSHFIDVCALIGHATPLEMDPSGTWFAFEAGVNKTEGGQGFADVFYRGRFAWEYKGKHADLKKAYAQLLQYHESLDSPPLLIVSDIERIEIHTKFQDMPKRVITLTLDDLLTPPGLAHLKNAFNNPEAFKTKQTIQGVTEDAAREFARLAKLLRDYGEDSHHAAHFLIRCLFCLYAEDIGLLPNRIFTRIVKSSVTKPESFHQRIEQLFAAMRDGGAFGVDDIKHFDGGLFDDATAPTLDSDGLQILAGACDLDWSSIEPSILGTLFTRSLDPAQRAALGAQYTSKQDILLIVEPVLMQPLRARWAEVQAQARAIAKNRQSKTTKIQTTIKQHRALRDLIVGFARELARIQVLDPACGSGNFLYVALTLLLALWKEVSIFGSGMGLPMLLPDINDAPSPLQMHGIETNPYAHDLAQTAIWIGYIQWRRDNGFGDPYEPILKPIETIRLMDAIMTPEGTEPEWTPADVIVGNPPFLGGNKIRQELGDEYVDKLFALYKDRVPAFADLVCYWFEKTRAMIEAGQVKRAGLLATNSIRGGANRVVLERIKKSGDIFMAWSDRDWILDGAAVNVSMVGFDNGAETVRQLDGKTVTRINADLTAVANVTQAKSLEENRHISFQGPSSKAPFDIEADVAKKMLDAKGNPNKRPNSDVVRPLLSAIDIAQEPRGLWTIDFGLMGKEEAAQYEIPFEYLKKNVYPIRSKNRRAAYAEKWWQYAEARPGMRKALEGKTRFIATPAHSKHRIFVWVDARILCNQATIVFARDDDYFFGVLHSRIHEIWALRMGTSLEDRPRYTPTTTFETFPFPFPPGKEPRNHQHIHYISVLARILDERRRFWLDAGGTFESAKTGKTLPRTLTNLYNERPTWLDDAHRALDGAVCDAYGWVHDLSDEEILGKLLALNVERSTRD